MPHYEDNPSPLSGPRHTVLVRDEDEVVYGERARALRIFEEMAREVKQGRHDHLDKVGVLREVYRRVRGKDELAICARNAQDM